MNAIQSICPECGKVKPQRIDDLHDVVLMRMDWRKAGRSERTTIEVPVGESPMCHQCFLSIEATYSPIAPTFDAKGKRI